MSKSVLLRRLSGRTFRQRLAALPGYASLATIKLGRWEDFLSGR